MTKRELENCVLDLCARIDLSGEKAKLDTLDGAMDYFTTVSMNIGCARIVIERTRGTDYYAERYTEYKQTDGEQVGAAPPAR